MAREHVTALVLCDNCDNPASESFSKEVGWFGCAACVTGESQALIDQIEEGDFILPEDKKKIKSTF